LEGSGDEDLSEIFSKAGELALRMVLGHQHGRDSQWTAISSITGKTGCTAQTPCNSLRQAKRDQGLLARPGSGEQVRVKGVEAMRTLTAGNARSLPDVCVQNMTYA